MRHDGFSFYGHRKSDEGADTDLIYNFYWPNNEIHTHNPATTLLSKSFCFNETHLDHNSTSHHDHELLGHHPWVVSRG